MIDTSDGVDYVRHSLYSEKDAPLGDMEPCDGSIRICLDEIWAQVKAENFVHPIEMAEALYKDVLGHEMNHKWFIWAMGEDFIETFNEMDERVMRVITDWIDLGKMSKMTDYDWKK